MSLWSRLTHPFRSGPRRPLAARKPVPDSATRARALGMEATDLDLVDAVNRRNDSLERVNTTFRPEGSKTAGLHGATRVTPMPEDETYAARYHRAFNKKGSDT